jgi:tetratricopeptide (TPR) repeat protein
MKSLMPKRGSRRPGQVGTVEYNRQTLSRQTIRLSLATTLLVGLVAAVLCGCSSGRADASNLQERFGVRMAKMNLWREAMFRFKRAVEMNPEDAMAHNNLAVAYEANGDFDAAAKEYREAIRLDKSNQYIQKNYSRYVEFTSRNRKRQQRTPPAQTAAATTPTETTPPADTPPATSTVAPVETPPPTPPATPPPLPPQDEQKPPGDLS